MAYLNERSHSAKLHFGVATEGPVDTFEEAAADPWVEQGADYSLLDLSPIVDLEVGSYETLDGFTDIFRGIAKGAGYVYGAIRSATAIGSAMTRATGDPATGGRLAAAMGAARTVGEQLQVWSQAIAALQARMGRQLTAQEYMQLEGQVWGPNGAPTGYPADYPAISAGGSGWVLPVLGLVAVYLITRRR
jgi:hypothetical protein